MKKNYSLVLAAVILMLLPTKNIAQAPNLGNATSFAVFTSVGGFNNVGTTTVTGNVGTNVGAFNAFPPGTLNGAIHVADATSALAAADVITAYNALGAATCTTVLGVSIINQTLTPNVYCTGAASTLNGNLTLDGQGNPNALFIIKIGGAFATGSTASVTLINAASICNVYWQINGQFDLGSNSIFRGTVIVNGAVNLLSGSTLIGRVLSQSGAITLDNNLVTIPTMPVASVISAGSSTTFCSGSSVVLSGNLNGTWNNSATTTSIAAITSGDYFVTNSNACGSVNSNHIMVTVNTTPTLAVAGGSICSSKSFTVVPTGAPVGSTYSINGGNNFTVSPTANTNYTVIATSSNNCVSSNSVITVTVSATPTLAVTGGSICSGNSFTVVPTGAPAGSTYSINGGNNFTVSPTTNTNYTVIATSSNNCVSSNSVITVSISATPTLAVNSGAICSGNSFTVVPTGAPVGSTYSINGGNNFTVSPTANTNYTVIATSSNNCVSSNSVITVTVSATPTLAVTGGSICSGNSFTVVPMGAPVGSTYSINGGNNFTVSPTANTNYTVIATSSNNCVSSNSVITVAISATPTLAVAGGSICSGESFTIVPTGAPAGSTYSINGGNNFTVSPTANTDYTVIATSSNNCVSSNSVITVMVSATPILVVNSGTICSGLSFTITPTGAAGGTYSITGNNFTVTPVTGSYSYTVTSTSSVGCVSSNTAISTVLVNALPTVSVNSGAICAGEIFTIIPSGANTYTVTGGNFTISPTSQTSYSVTGTDTNGCVSSNTAVSTVSINALPTVSVNSGAICAGKIFTITPSGASTYTVTDGNFTVSPTSQTSYSVTGTSSVGCVSSNTVVSTVSVNALPIISVNSGVICTGKLFTITPSGASTYTVTGGNFTVSPTSQTSYSVTGTSSVGCVSANTVVSTVSVNALPNLSVTGTETICAGETTTLTASGASTYTWNTGTWISYSPSISSSCMTTMTYTVSGTNTLGCVSSKTVSVYVDACTGIDKFEVESLKLKVYPNPNNGEFTIDSEENIQIIVMNSIGKVVYQQTTTNVKTEISLQGMSAGIYFIKAISNNHQQIVKMIKQ